jgi:glycosyltransferase involved in cell wall biosynthesis
MLFHRIKDYGGNSMKTQSLLVVTDKLIYKYNKSYYSSGGFPHQINAFNKEFNLSIFAPVVRINDENLLENLNRLQCIEVIEISSKSKIHMIFSAFYFSFVVNKNSYNYVQLRLPSKNSMIFYLTNMKRFNYFSITGGHPYYGYANGLQGQYPNFLIKLFGKISLFITRLIMKSGPSFVTGKQLAQDFRKYDPISVISTSISEQEIQNSSVDTKSLHTLIFVGRFSKEKNIPMILRAIKKLIFVEKIKVKLQLIGEGPEEKKIKEYVTTNNLEEWVEFLGPIYNRKKLLNQIKKAGLFLLTSTTEGTPKVLIESMSQGTPVIATDVGGIRGVIRQNNNGLLINSNDDDQLVIEIKKMFHDNIFYNEIRENGYIFASENTLQSYMGTIKKNLRH